MSYTEIQGDLFEADLDVLAHGCNCKGFMGAGIAVEFAKRWPAMEDEYAKLCRSGEFSPGDYFLWNREKRPVIYNLMTQDAPGADARVEAIQAAVDAMIADLEWEHTHSPATVGMPRIGCGIGGLQWPEVEAVIRPLAEDTIHHIRVYFL